MKQGDITVMKYRGGLLEKQKLVSYKQSVFYWLEYIRNGGVARPLRALKELGVRQ